MTHKLLFVLFLAVVSHFGAIADDPLEVKVVTGLLQGKWAKSRDGRSYRSFEGIPYAKKPTRFQPPEPPENWADLRMATYPRAWCPQLEEVSQTYADYTEDCLFLNVYIPQVQNPSPDIPTMVWIHGGAYRSGAGSVMGPQYFMDTDVIIVTLNYRLGAFGFLSTDDDIVAGNMGLKDMIMALKWIQNNIHSFGGDPQNVTLFGESAGGAAVHTISISPAARGLFKKVIAQSGTALCPWAFRPEGLTLAKKLASRLGCMATATNEMVECMKGRSVRQILEAQREFFEVIPSFTAVLDAHAGADAVLPAHPSYLIALSDRNVPFMIGQTRREGLGFVQAIVNNGNYVNYLNTNWTAAITEALGFDRHINAKDVPAVAEQIHELYFNGKNITANSWLNMTNLFTDYSFYYGIKEAMLHHAKAGMQVYPYMFSYQGNFSLTGIPNEGPAHADELQYMFQSLLVPELNWPTLEKGSPDEQFSREFISLWSSFGIFGKPSPWHDTTWEAINLAEVTLTDDPRLEFYYIDTDASKYTESAETTRRLEFWRTAFYNQGENTVPSFMFAMISALFSYYISA